jgi:hypothetical protein
MGGVWELVRGTHDLSIGGIPGQEFQILITNSLTGEKGRTKLVVRDVPRSALVRRRGQRGRFTIPPFCGFVQHTPL